VPVGPMEVTSALQTPWSASRRAAPHRGNVHTAVILIDDEWQSDLLLPGFPLGSPIASHRRPQHFVPVSPQQVVRRKATLVGFQGPTPLSPEIGGTRLSSAAPRACPIGPARPEQPAWISVGLKFAAAPLRRMPADACFAPRVLRHSIQSRRSVARARVLIAHGVRIVHLA
jgi:hypothetical protein